MQENSVLCGLGRLLHRRGLTRQTLEITLDGPPEVTVPADQSTVTITGRTSAGNYCPVSYYCYQDSDQRHRVAPVDSDGRFSFEVPINSQENLITVSIMDRDGQVASNGVVVYKKT